MSNAVNKSKPFVRDSTIEDCVYLAQNMRQEDIQEVFYAASHGPLESLSASLEMSQQCHTIEWNGRVVAMFGCAAVHAGLGIPWMLATDDLKRIQKSFLREAKDYFQAMQDAHGYLTNYVWAENYVHIKWLRWMGVTFDPPEPYGTHGELFMRFHRGTYV